MKMWCIVCLLLSTFIQLHIAPGVDRKEKQEMDEFYDIENLPQKQAQDREYFRYVLKVIRVLEHDPVFRARTESLSDKDIRAGKLTQGLMILLSVGVKEDLNRLKKEEVEHQRNLLADNKTHMVGAERNEWNPIHHDDKETFSQDDLTILLGKFNDMMAVLDGKRREDFKAYEMKKELDRREISKNKTEEEKAQDEIKSKLHREKKHDKMHEPGHEAQMKEVWEKGDGLDPDSFDLKTFFNLHDKNSDGYLDKFELETWFLQDLDKVYPESDPDTDPKERDEEMERMREHAMKNMDLDNNGLVSVQEFMKIAEDEKFSDDEEWNPLSDSELFTEDELDEFRQMSKEDTRPF